MANSVFIEFFIDVLGDGQSTTVVIDFSQHPVFFKELFNTSGVELSSEFSPSKPAPVAVVNLSASNVIGGVSSFSLSGHILTLTLASAFSGAFEVFGQLIY